MRGKIEKTFEMIEPGVKAEPVDVVANFLGVAAGLKQIYEHSVDIADLAMPKPPVKEKR